MRKFAATFLLAFAFLPATFAASDSAAQNRYIFYKATKPGVTFYLLGAMHIGRPEGEPYTTAIFSALEKSQKLIFESEVRHEKIRMPAANTMYLPTGVTVEKFMTKADVALLQKMSERLGIATSALNRLQPWLIEIMAAYRLGFMKGYVLEYGTEYTLMRHVKNKMKGENKPGIMALEGQDEVFSKMKGVPLTDQIARLRIVLQYYLTADTQAIEDLIEVWRRGDIDKMWRLYTQQKDPSPETERFYDLLLFQRNRTMAERLVLISRYPGTYFVAPGAMHLVGERSIISHLRTAGFSIERL